jgi:hypothetical protein
MNNNENKQIISASEIQDATVEELSEILRKELVVSPSANARLAKVRRQRFQTLARAAAAAALALAADATAVHYQDQADSWSDSVSYGGGGEEAEAQRSFYEEEAQAEKRRAAELDAYVQQLLVELLGNGATS